MDAFDLVSKERVNTPRPACRSCRQSSGCRAPSTRSTSIEQPGRAPPPAASEGTSRALLDRPHLEQHGWPAPTRHTRST
eukprot:scaffold102140_cov105-Phaeocystis_antarctica.AAC.1